MIQAKAFNLGIPEDPSYQVVTTSEDFERWQRFMVSRPALVMDYETSGLQYYKQARSVGIGLGSWDDGGRFWSCYIPYRHHTWKTQLDFRRIASDLGALLGNQALKIGHNIKFEDHFSRIEGWSIEGPRYDTMVAARLYDENESAQLENRAARDLGLGQAAYVGKEILEKEIRQLAKTRRMKIREYKSKYGYKEVDIDLCGYYCTRDLVHTGGLYSFYERYGVSTYFSRIWETEMHLTRVLADMEHEGMPVNIEYLNNLRIELQVRKQRIYEQVYNAIGEINLAADAEVLSFLKDTLGLPLWKRTRGGVLSVDKEVLEEFEHQHPVLPMIMDWREANKLDTTYTQSIIDQLDGHGYVHGDLQSVGTNTGRLSCRSPNYHNFPSDSDDRSVAHTGKKLEEGGYDPWSIHRAFPCRPGYVRLYADYCLHPSTLVETVKGKVPIGKLGAGDKVFTLRERRIDCGEVSEVVDAGQLPSYRMTLDNGEVVVASEHHRWPVRERRGYQWELVDKRTAELNVGDRLVPMRRTEGGGGYTHLYAYSNREYTKEHLLVARAEFGPKPAGMDVHHKNEVKSDNRPSNLVYVPKSQHRSAHGKECYKNQDHTLRLQKLRSALKDRRSYKGEGNPNFGKRKGVERPCLNCGEGFYSPPSKKQKYCTHHCYVEARWDGLNHKVVAIEFVGLQPMVSIAVEPDHNYVLGCGVVTRNSQVELRMLAYYSGDPIMVDAYLTGQDIHDRTSKEVGVTRRVAKVINFGLSYCMTAAGLARNAKISYPEAEQFLNGFFKQYHGIVQFRHQLWTRARAEQCQVINVFGRRRYVPNLASPDMKDRTRAERQLIGSLIQGTAAELTKESLVRLDRAYKAQGIPALLVNTVHDEIQIDVPREYLGQCAQVTKAEMERYPEFNPIPIIVDLEVTETDWSEKTDWA